MSLQGPKNNERKKRKEGPKKGREGKGEGGGKKGRRREEAEIKQGKAGAGLCVKRWYIKYSSPVRSMTKIKVHGPNEH